MRTIKSRTRKTPQQQCEIVHEAWGPHEGCREYMTGPEAVIRCSSPSTHEVKMTSPWDGRITSRVCREHAREHRSDEFVTVRGIYRYRTV